MRLLALGVMGAGAGSYDKARGMDAPGSCVQRAARQSRQRKAVRSSIVRWPGPAFATSMWSMTSLKS
ncbi:hypothetical protein FHX68_1534 [Microbacterium lacticum]|uniref:Uncharacterized protein n=1 Tax=Microbacterium lacticum TaxID=33885 RepID=A0A543KUQ0_9MICO|nr:hypothetical protein FHX68_1534 [Microbacterium lacticum]